MFNKESSPIRGTNKIKNVAQIALAVGLALSADSNTYAAPGHSALDPEPAEKCWEVFGYYEETPSATEMEERRFYEINYYYPPTPEPTLVPYITLDCDFDLVKATSPKK